jgi:hypothetical protein
MLVESGSYDSIFPRKAVEKSIAGATDIYKRFGKQALETDYFEGRHQISGRKAYAFLRGALI